MSPRRYVRLPDDARFPRVSGDEPTLTADALAADMFSPREWG